MEKRKYHYEYVAYTSNLCYGRQEIARDRNRSYVFMMAWNANKGAFEILREKVYDK